MPNKEALQNLRDSLIAATMRAQSVSSYPRVSIGQSHQALRSVERQQEMPPAAPLVVQDSQGVFRYLPGLDGPV